MPIEGFSYDERHDLWIADGLSNLVWTDGSEAYLLEVLREVGEAGDYPIELAGFIRDWPSRYHLSHQRVNLLEAIRPLLDASWKALEIGGGTGILTKWLARAVTQVDVIEGSSERARVNRARTRGDGNVRVLVGDMVAAPFPGTYDLATLVGVLEYVPVEPGATRRQACLGLLRKIRDSLSDNGVLLLAIENRLGAKYWTGCGEDHTTRLFDGLMGYPDDTPITFSRTELEALLREAGFAYQQFYHLHPDYKLPTTVIREVAGLENVAAHHWTQQFAQDYMNPREYLMPDPLLMKSVEAAGLFWQFSNSFLVLCSRSDRALLADDWLIKKFSNSSRPELHHTVTLVEREGVLRVERTPLRRGRSHVDLGDYEWALSDTDYTPGSLLMMEAHEALVSQHWLEGLTALCRELLDAARIQYGGGHISEEGGFDTLDGGALDFTFWNVVRCADGSLRSVDAKWTQKGGVPADYVLFRSLFFLLSAGSPFVRVGLRDAIKSLLQQFFSNFDDARLDGHLERERRLQECVHAGGPSRVLSDAEGRLVVPLSGGSLPDKLQRLASAETRAALAADFEAQLREARIDREVLRANLDEAQAQSARLRSELGEAQGRCAQLQAERDKGQAENVGLRGKLDEARLHIADIRNESDARAVQLAAVYASTSWRVSAPVRLLGRQIVRLRRYEVKGKARRQVGRLARLVAPGLMKRRALRLAPLRPVPKQTEGPTDPLLLAAEAGRLEYRPLVSVVVPVYQTDPRFLRLAVESVLAQAYTEWELILCDDGSTRADTRATLKELALLDPRIQVHYLGVNSGIATATNAALAEARGEFVAMLDHDDELLPAALLEVVKALNDDRTLDVIYTDQDYMEADGSLAQNFYKPDWSLELFRGVMYVGHLLVVRRSLAGAIGGFDPTFDNVQDFEFMLRLAEKTDRIAHVPKVLYRWRKIPGSVAFGGDEKRNIEPLQAAAVNAHLERCGIKAVARSNPDHAHRVLITPLPSNRHPLITVLVRASGTEGHLEACCGSILASGSYPNKEVVVTGGIVEEDLVERLQAIGVGFVAPGQDGAAAVLAGLKEAAGEVIVSMAGDLEVQTPDWLEHLVFGCGLPGIACVAPLVLASDGLVSSAGSILSEAGIVGPAMRGLQPGSDGYAGSLSCVREVSAVSGDCWAVARRRLDDLGGLSPYFADDRLQTADLSLRALSAGLRHLCTPRVVVRHRMPAGSGETPDVLDELLLADAWEPLIKKGDPFHNPNFKQVSPGYQE